VIVSDSYKNVVCLVAKNLQRKLAQKQNIAKHESC
jgi:hypothetical protein